MNRDQVSGKIDQAVGKVKQSVGETVGNNKLANQGVIDQTAGAVKEIWGDAKDAARQVHESHRKTAAEKADQSRDKIGQSVQNAKNKLKDKIEAVKERHSE
jgi:uncharacterized protein YjbJ (UPF0337 family)